MNFALGVGEIHPCAQRQRNPGPFGKGEIQVEFSFRKVSAGNKTLQPVYIVMALAQTVFWGLCSPFWAGSQLNSHDATQLSPSPSVTQAKAPKKNYLETVDILCNRL